MKCQKKPENEEKHIYLSPERSPLDYELELSNSSQGSFFHYSAIDVGPVTYELDSKPLCGTYAASAHCDLTGKMNFTMKKPDAYLRCTGKYSSSSEIHN